MEDGGERLLGLIDFIRSRIVCRSKFSEPDCILQLSQRGILGTKKKLLNSDWTFGYHVKGVLTLYVNPTTRIAVRKLSEKQITTANKTNSNWKRRASLP